MVRCDGNRRLCEQDDGGPQQDAGWDGGEGEHTSFSISLDENALNFFFFSKVGMLFRYLATGISGFVFPFTKVESQKQC